MGWALPLKPNRTQTKRWTLKADWQNASAWVKAKQVLFVRVYTPTNMSTHTHKFYLCACTLPQICPHIHTHTRMNTFYLKGTDMNARLPRTKILEHIQESNHICSHPCTPHTFLVTHLRTPASIHVRIEQQHLTYSRTLLFQGVQILLHTVPGNPMWCKIAEQG